jgi:hypothetical protein
MKNIHQYKYYKNKEAKMGEFREYLNESVIRGVEAQYIRSILDIAMENEWHQVDASQDPKLLKQVQKFVKKVQQSSTKISLDKMDTEFLKNIISDYSEDWLSISDDNKGDKSELKDFLKKFK